MAVARSTEELQKQIMAEMSKAMNKARTQMLKDMQEGTDFFYAKGPGRKYKRTGALGNTPTTSPLQPSTNGYAFLAYLNPAHQYTTGDYPSMWQVLFLADRGQAWRTKSGQMARATVGNKGFWRRSEKSMEETFNKVMKEHFN